jgi:uncharacterized protein (DUF488 family)
MRELFTIGVYGFSSSAFYDKLKSAKIDAFCDIRRRRGVRGSDYAFANAKRLQSRLEELGIPYHHCVILAPSDELRQRQAKADKASRTARRKRLELSPKFIEGYQELLARFDSEVFDLQLGREVERPVLFCVERDPAACHRSLLAERLARDLGIKVTHLLP